MHNGCCRSTTSCPIRKVSWTSAQRCALGESHGAASVLSLVIASRDPAILEVSGDAVIHAVIHVDAQDTAELAEAMRAVAAFPEKFAQIKSDALARAA